MVGSSKLSSPDHRKPGRFESHSALCFFYPVRRCWPAKQRVWLGTARCVFGRDAHRGSSAASDTSTETIEVDGLRLSEIALVFVCFDHVAAIIVNANQRVG